MKYHIFNSNDRQRLEKARAKRMRKAKRKNPSNYTLNRIQPLHYPAYAALELN
jgi:hypothetical protein